MPFSIVLNNGLIPILYLRHRLHLKNMVLVFVWTKAVSVQ